MQYWASALHKEMWKFLPHQLPSQFFLKSTPCKQKYSNKLYHFILSHGYFRVKGPPTTPSSTYRWNRPTEVTWLIQYKIESDHIIAEIRNENSQVQD